TGVQTFALPIYRQSRLAIEHCGNDRTLGSAPQFTVRSADLSSRNAVSFSCACTTDCFPSRWASAFGLRKKFHVFVKCRSSNALDNNMETNSIAQDSGWDFSFWFAISSPLVGVLLGILAAAVVCRVT